MVEFQIKKLQKFSVFFHPNLKMPSFLASVTLNLYVIHGYIYITKDTDALETVKARKLSLLVMLYCH